MEANLWEAVQNNDLEVVQKYRQTDVVLHDLAFTQAVIAEAVSLGNKDMVTAVVDLFAYNNQNAHKVCVLNLLIHFVQSCFHIITLLKVPC